MVDTVRSISDLIALLANNTSNAISPQDLRDVLVTLASSTGWVDYTDTAYTDEAPFPITAGVPTAIPNNAGNVRNQEMPSDLSELWNTSGNYIPGRAGDSYLVVLEFKIRRASGTADFSFTNYIDIGGSVDPLYESKRTVNGTEDSPIFYAPPVYTLDTWATNGGQTKIITDVDCELYKPRHVIHRLHRGQGNYS